MSMSTNTFMNINNFGIARGRLACDPAIHVNQDGSRSVDFTLVVENNYLSRDFKILSCLINFKAFIPAERESDGLYGKAHKGDFLTVHYTVKYVRYEKNGEEVFVQELQVKGANFEKFAEKKAEAIFGENFINTSNFGIARGRLTNDPAVYVNKDGSRSVLFTLATANNYKVENGKGSGQFTNAIGFKAFIPPEEEGNGVYDIVRKDDLLNVQYTVWTSSYEKNGESVFVQELYVSAAQMEGFAAKDAVETLFD